MKNATDLGVRILFLLSTVTLSALLALAGCSPGGDGAEPGPWEAIKASIELEYDAGEYHPPFAQPLSTLGWEDGIYMSRDGLDLYCIYAPGDLLSFTISGPNPDPTAFGPYLRGPTFGMDLVSNPVGASSWIHGDILYAHRASTAEAFTSWTLSGMARPVFSEGAPVQLDKSGNTLGRLLFTSNDKDPTYDTDIWELTGCALNPAGIGAPLANFPHTDKMEDNPHIERIDANTLVLMFDSNDYPGGLGSHDIWYSVSADNGTSWSAPSNAATINTALQEHQPHLFHDGTDWYLYFSATHTDGKLAIFRSRQTAPNNWNSWGARELVIGAGNSAGVGEPTLTSAGDISFVVVYENTDGAPYNRYEADPWFMGKR